ncbi:conjugal transfer protein TraF [Sulfuricurvum sp.]|uniref:conjugal transfer protein TraF n=1 Tax=Sulfuricurvum sp. TaxID=2025608 RepID=UPI003C4B31B6
MPSSKILLSFVASACVATLSSGMEFQVLGAKAASMGGAGIATSPSSLAAYNNPALLANNPEKFSIHLGAGIGLKDTGAGKAVGDLSDLDFSGVSDLVDGNAQNATTEQIDTLTQARDIILGMDGTGFQVNPTADLAISFGSFGTGLFGTSDIGGIANVDQTHTDLIFETSTPGQYINILTFDPLNPVYLTTTDYQASSLYYAAVDESNTNKTTNVDIVGLAVFEIPLAYGHAFNTEYGSLSVGGALKYMKGKTFYKSVALDDDNALDNINDNAVDSSSFGIDLGLAFKPEFSQELTLALVGKNLNTPSFDKIGGGEYEIKPAVRAGGAYKFNEWAELAMDVDLTENESLVGYNTRYIGGGANFDLSALELNIGLMKNIASNDEAGVIYTAGLATGPDWLHFELSAQMSSKSGEIDGSSYPKQAMVNFAISSAF